MFKQSIVFAIQQLCHMPDGLKNLGASSFRHFWKGERLRVTGASEKCIVTKKHATNLQNSDALCSQTCTFAMGPGSGCNVKLFFMTNWCLRISGSGYVDWKNENLTRLTGTIELQVSVGGGFGNSSTVRSKGNLSVKGQAGGSEAGNSHPAQKMTK